MSAPARASSIRRDVRTAEPFSSIEYQTRLTPMASASSSWVTRLPRRDATRSGQGSKRVDPTLLDRNPTRNSEHLAGLLETVHHAPFTNARQPKGTPP